MTKKTDTDEPKDFVFTDETLGTSVGVVEELINLFDQARKDNRPYIMSRVGARFEARVRAIYAKIQEG